MLEDFHAARVLPGYEPDNKINLLQELRDQVEIVVPSTPTTLSTQKPVGIQEFLVTKKCCVWSTNSMNWGFFRLVITQYAGQAAADAFRKQLDKSGIASYLHYPIKGLSDRYGPHHLSWRDGENDYIKTSRNLVVVTAPGPGSGKLATVCPICTMTSKWDQIRLC